MPIWRRCGESKERRAADPSPRKPDMIAPFELPLATVALQRETGQWHPASGTVPSLHVTSFAGSFHLPTLRGASGQATVGSAVCRWPARTERPALSGQASAEGGMGWRKQDWRSAWVKRAAAVRPCASRRPLRGLILEGEFGGRQAGWTGACSRTPLQERRPKGQGDAAGPLALGSACVSGQAAPGGGAVLRTARRSAASLPRAAGCRQHCSCHGDRKCPQTWPNVLRAHGWPCGEPLA